MWKYEKICSLPLVISKLENAYTCNYFGQNTIVTKHKKQTMFITNKSKSSQKPTTCWFLMKCSLLRCLFLCGTVCLSKMFNHESYRLTLSLWHHRSSIATWAFQSSTEAPTSCEWSHVNLLHSKHLPGISNHYGTRRSTNTLRWHFPHASELIAKVRRPKEFVSTNVIISSCVEIHHGIRSYTVWFESFEFTRNCCGGSCSWEFKATACNC